MIQGMKRRVYLGLTLTVYAPALAQPKWWMDEPVCLIQTNLRETDSTLDVEKLARQVAEFPANALLFNMGGIVAHYPTRVAFHYASPHLPAGRDTFGDILKAAHSRGIRVIGRFDFSKTQKPVFDAHPEWFFHRQDGGPVVYNGLYSTCLNGGYYREHIFTILAETLKNYEVDGLFFNMFGNPSTDYNGNYVGLCHCDACASRFRERFGRALPEKADAEYARFMSDSRLEVAARIGDLIHRLRPQAAFLTYIQEHVDGIMSESNTAVKRPLPLWPYSASDNFNRARNSEPGKMAFNLCMSFIDFPWRFATVPPAEIQLRLWQAMAHGAGPALNMHGPMDQQDQSALMAARPVFQWHKQHEHLYVRQESAARVVLLGARQESYRGFFRILSERHIPFAVYDNLAWTQRPRSFDLVIAPFGAPQEARPWVERGGALLIAGTGSVPFDVGKPVHLWTNTQGYWRIRDHGLFPSLKQTQLLFMDGDYQEYAPEAAALLTLIPPSMFGPPEKVHVDWRDTDKPGLIMRTVGKGRVAYLPWDLGGLYYRHSSPAHAALAGDLIDHLLAGRRQLRSNAHPLVEITLMKQPSHQRWLVHFVNLSGHADTAYFEPVPMSNVEAAVEGAFRRARSVGLRQELPLEKDGAYQRFTLPNLRGYDVVVLEQ